MVTFPVAVPVTRGLDKKDRGKRPLYLLQEPFLFRVNGILRIIPAGFEFDYASVPKGLWNLFPPYDPEYAAAALIHDWLYAGELCPRLLADRVFLEAMRFRNVAQWKRNVMYAAVVAFGGMTYKEHTEESIREIRMLSGITKMDRPLWETL